MIQLSRKHITYILTCFILLDTNCIHARYEVPTALVEPLLPRGFRVSIADDPNHRINIFAFHGRVNEELNRREAGQFSKDITRPINGRWTFEDTKTELKSGDIIYYWTYVELIAENGGKLGYPLDDQKFTVEKSQPTHTQEQNKIITTTALPDNNDNIVFF